MSIRLTAWAALLLVVASAGCTPPDQEPDVNVAVALPTLAHDLHAVAAARILLGHQSVGRNLLAGLGALSEEHGVPLRIVEIDGVPPDDGPGIFHSNIGRNGDPESKCEVFARLLDRPERPRYDLAMMKFCYVDLGRDTPLEVAAMLERYTALVEQIRRARPDVRLVHVTMPLVADPPGKKTWLKRLVGLPTALDADSALRSAYNDALRERFAGEPLFDLARVESTRPDGTRSSFSRDGKEIPTLAPPYTDDGAHLNAEGQRRAAVEFVRTMAAALRTGSE
ncbi:MAG TPA: SGNH/GDSL hydrolase family protein [Pseudomonadales bacterium]